MIDLFTAVMARYDSDDGATLRALLTGGLHHLKAPQGTSYPYGIFFLVSDVPVYTFQGKPGENTLIQFNLFSGEPSAIDLCNIYEAVKTLYDWCTLTYGDEPNYEHVYMEREFANLLWVEDVWQYSVEYRILLDKL